MVGSIFLSKEAADGVGVGVERGRGKGTSPRMCVQGWAGHAPCPWTQAPPAADPAHSGVMLFLPFGTLSH